MCTKCKAEQNSEAQEKWMDRSPPSALHFVGDACGQRFVGTQPSGLGFLHLHKVLATLHARMTTDRQLEIINELTAVNNSMGEVNCQLVAMKSKTKNPNVRALIDHAIKSNEETAKAICASTDNYMAQSSPVRTDEFKDPDAQLAILRAEYGGKHFQMNMYGGENNFKQHPDIGDLIREDAKSLQAGKDAMFVAKIDHKGGQIDIPKLRYTAHVTYGCFEILVDEKFTKSDYPAGPLIVTFYRRLPGLAFEVQSVESAIPPRAVVIRYDNSEGDIVKGIADVIANQSGILKVDNLAVLPQIDIPKDFLSITLVPASANNLDSFFIDTIISHQGSIAVSRTKSNQPEDAALPARSDVRVEMTTGEMTIYVNHPGGLFNHSAVSNILASRLGYAVGIHVPVLWNRSEYVGGFYSMTFKHTGHDGSFAKTAMLSMSGLKNIDNDLPAQVKLYDLTPPQGDEQEQSAVPEADVVLVNKEGQVTESLQVVKIRHSWKVGTSEDIQRAKITLNVTGQGKFDLTAMSLPNVYIAEELRNKTFYAGPATLRAFRVVTDTGVGYLVHGVSQLESSSLKLTDAGMVIAWEGFYNFMSEIPKATDNA